ncbi:MAG: Crp/Fnr family transcriptional regulator [Bacteroidaceae bacterium]|nr:Crp/Fnr family transcriptional regulator [Bacteroidaceae bacterium]
MDLNELKNSDFFKGLSEEDIATLLFSSPGALRKYNEGDYVARQGEVCDKIAIMTKGAVYSVMINNYGKELIMANIESPNLLGYTYIFASINKFNVNVIAKSPCEMVFIEKERLLALMHERPVFMQSFMRGMADRSLMVFGRLFELNLHSLKQRLLKYFESNSDIPNQTELAKRFGVTRPSLSRALAELKRDGLIKK